MVIGELLDVPAIVTHNEDYTPGLGRCIGVHGHAATREVYDISACVLKGDPPHLIAILGDPLKEITAVRRVVFVMKGGIVYKCARSARQLLLKPSCCPDWILVDESQSA